MNLINHFKYKINILILLNAILSLLLLYIIMFSPSLSSYEISLYDSFPDIFWYLIIIIFTIAQFIILQNIFNYDKRTNTIVLGVAFMIFINNIILFLPYIRGYFIYGREDHLSQIGYIYDILNTSHIPSSNPYPLEHTLCVIFYYIIHVDFLNIPFIIPIIYTSLYLISMVILLKIFSSSKQIIIYSSIFINPLLFKGEHFVLTPFSQSFFYLPLAIYLYLKYLKSEGSIISTVIILVIMFTITFFHPLTLLIYVICILSFYISVKLHPKYHLFNSVKWMKFNKNILLFSLFLFLIWRNYINTFITSFKNLYDWLISDSGVSQAQVYLSLIDIGGLTIDKLINAAVSLYGQWIVIVLTTSTLIVCTVWKSNIKETFNRYIISGFTIFLLLSVIIFIVPLVIGFERVLQVAIIFAIIFLSIYSYKLLIVCKYSRLRNVLVVFLLVFIIAINYFYVFNIYTSPKIKGVNQQISRSEYFGMKFFFQMRDRSLTIRELGISQSRFYDLIYGRESIRANISNNPSILPPDHFGYAANKSFSDNYSSQNYLLLNSISKEFYPSIYPEFSNKWKFTPTDFKKIENDNQVDLVFSNSNVQVFITK